MWRKILHAVLLCLQLRGWSYKSDTGLRVQARIDWGNFNAFAILQAVQIQKMVDGSYFKIKY